jgi:hypothetical protein
VLTGRSLSRVQELALEMLLLVDQRERSAAFYDDLRARMVAQDPTRISALFPEWVPPARLADPEEEPDPRALEWAVPATAEEAVELDRWVASRPGGVVTAVELDGGNWT